MPQRPPDLGPIEDLAFVPVEDFDDADGNRCVCVYNRKIDAVTFIDEGFAKQLRLSGVMALDALPE